MGDMPAPAPRFGRAPEAWPLLGHMVALQRWPLALLDSLPARGDLVEIRLGPRPAYVVCHPGLARQVLSITPPPRSRRPCPGSGSTWRSTWCAPGAARAGGRHNGGTGRLGQLDGVPADRAARPVDQHALPGRQVDVLEHAPAVLASQLQLPAACGCSATAAAGGAHLLLEDPGAATVV
jgi:hypothetical protein